MLPTLTDIEEFPRIVHTELRPLECQSDVHLPRPRTLWSPHSYGIGTEDLSRGERERGRER